MMRRELALRQSELDKPLETIYFGGGTPSLLSLAELNEFLVEIRNNFSVKADAEITLEGNPDDLTPEYLEGLRQLGINRLSIGLQSLRPEELKLMNRIHTSEKAAECVRDAQKAGFSNISLDLIYGSPDSTLVQWQETLEKVLALEVPHISAYALTVEPNTLLEHQIRKGLQKNTNDGLQNEQFFQMVETLQAAGYDHYEISNFGKPGAHSRHNTGYWQQKPYVGIGPSAHSFDGQNRRSWNVANNAQYINSLKDNILPATEEILTPSERFNEFIMIGLRTQAGLDIDRLEREFNPILQNHFWRKAQGLLEDKILIREENHLKLAQNQRFYADGLAAQLFHLP